MPNASATADSLARAEQAVIDEDADHPSGPAPSPSRAAATAESTPPERPQTTRSVGPTCVANRLDRAVDEGFHRPRAGALADAVEEVAEDQVPVGRVARPRGGTGGRRPAARGAGRPRRGRSPSPRAGRSRAPGSWTWSPWLIQTVVGSGTPWKSGSSGASTRHSARPNSRPGDGWTIPPSASQASCMP